MGNQTSFGSSRKSSSIQATETLPDHFEIFRRQSLHKTSIPPKSLGSMQYIKRDNLNKSHSLHNLNATETPRRTSVTAANLSTKSRRLSIANETYNTKKQLTATKVGNKATNSNSEDATTRSSPMGNVSDGDQQVDTILNGFGTASSSTPTSMQNNQRTTANGLSSSGRSRSIKKSEATSHPITLNGREIIQFCWENASVDFGTRLCTRVFEKRLDFQKFSQQMGREKWFGMAHNLRDFLYQVILKIDSLDVVEKLARKYGEDHLALKCYGFKPDFWVTLADLLTVEGVMLDLATHTHTETVTAWSLFVSILFSSIRDGYYNAMREQRNSIRKKSLRQATTPNTIQQLQIPNDGVSCSSSSPNGSMNNNLADTALLPNNSNMLSCQELRTSINLEGTNEGQLNVTNSRKSSAASNCSNNGVINF